MVDTLLALVFIASSMIYSMDELVCLQLSGYRYLPKVKNKEEKFLSLLILIVGAVAALLDFASFYASVALTLVFLTAFFSYQLKKYLKRRTKLVFTNRAVRLLFAVFILLILIYSLIVVFVPFSVWFFALSFIILFKAPYIATATNALIAPFERKNNKRYIDKAKEKFDALKAVKIAITGSYGKTSCKNILAAMLSRKYKVLATKASYNTPMGLVITSKEIKGDEEIFIAEMGARRIGDIKELTDIVEPRYAIITGVGNQHLQSFGSEENVFKAKSELVENLPSDGYAVFNGDNEGAVRMTGICPSEYTTVHIKDKMGVYATNIRLTNAGSHFDIHGLGKPFSVVTKLLGRHNITNILLSAALAKKLNVENEDIKAAIFELQPIQHRLELIENQRSITIIDDSYNCNIEGAFFALEVLSQFEGRKIVFTQGIIELGGKAEEVNRDLGAMVAEVASEVFLTGENTVYIKRGLVSAGFMGVIREFSSLAEATSAFPELLKPGDVLLLQNDLP